MIACRPTGISPFAPTYGMEAVVPIEISMPTLRTDIPGQLNNEYVIINLDMTDELCKVAAIQVALYCCRLANLYNRRVRPRVFQLGDLV